MPVSTTCPIVKPAHGASSPVTKCCSEEQQDWVTTLFSSAETFMLHEIKCLTYMIKEKDNNLIKLRSKLNNEGSTINFIRNKNFL